MPINANSPWPFLKTYQGAFLNKVVLPVGGIGTGSVGFAGNGGWRDWEIMNVPAKGYTPASPGRLTRPVPSLLIRYRQGREDPRIRVLEGPIPATAYEGAEGAAFPNANFPRFEDASCATAYPFAEVTLRDRNCPIRVRLQCFNPFIPGDTPNSSWPAAFVRCVVENPTATEIDSSIAFSLPNFIGADGGTFAVNPHSGAQVPSGYSKNRNRFFTQRGISGLAMGSQGVDRKHCAWGTMSLTTNTTSGISYRESWADLGWGDALLDFHDDLLRDGKIENHPASNDAPMASLCVRRQIPPRGSAAISFLLTWHFPNRTAWPPHDQVGDQWIGNHYAARFRNARTVAEEFWPVLPELESRTRTFVSAFLSSDLPAAAKEAALFNLSTLRTQTCFRARDGRFFAWEGIFDRRGSCFGSCNHVWNYEQALGSLFPELSHSMHRTAFVDAMDERGMMPFRIALNAHNEPFPYAAADGQTGHVVRVFRDWSESGNQARFAELWPGVRRALEFCWIPGGWDADADGVMEGCQHNTMDVEYYGPNPQMQTWYLAALAAAESMARQAGDHTFAEHCGKLFDRGRRWMERHLFNGDYFEQKVRPTTAIAPGLRLQLDATGDDPGNPGMQLGAGCLIDQLVGEWAARLSGLERMLDPILVRRTLRSILRHNRRKSAGEHFNHLRTYALGNEPSVVMASYPRGRRPKRPFPYFNETMTGFEYVLAGHLMMERMDAAAIRCVRDIRSRYDGRKRNPYNEAECGHHYGRALASWGLVKAWSGFRHHAPSRTIAIDRIGRHFWAAAGNWGTVTLEREETAACLVLQVFSGGLEIDRIESPHGHWEGPTAHLEPGKTIRFQLRKSVPRKASRPRIETDASCRPASRFSK